MLEILAYRPHKIKGEKKEALEFSKSLTKHWLQDISLSHVKYTYILSGISNSFSIRPGSEFYVSYTILIMYDKVESSRPKD